MLRAFQIVHLAPRVRGPAPIPAAAAAAHRTGGVGVTLASGARCRLGAPR